VFAFGGLSVISYQWSDERGERGENDDLITVFTLVALII
jgi:hypothetical protein